MVIFLSEKSLNMVSKWISQRPETSNQWPVTSHVCVPGFWSILTISTVAGCISCIFSWTLTQLDSHQPGMAFPSLLSLLDFRYCRVEAAHVFSFTYWMTFIVSVCCRDPSSHGFNVTSGLAVLNGILATLTLIWSLSWGFVLSCTETWRQFTLYETFGLFIYISVWQDKGSSIRALGTWANLEILQLQFGILYFFFFFTIYCCTHIQFSLFLWV